MSLMVGIKSCQRDREAGFHSAIRETWGGNLPHALYFFMGGESGGVDEIGLDCPDGYWELPYKTKAILQWFLKTEASHIFLCDCDTFVLPSTFGLGYEAVDYAGKISYWPVGAQMGATFRYNDGRGNVIDPCHAWASGGYGYFLSRKAAEAVIPVTPLSWAEDLFVGQVMGPLLKSGDIQAKDLDLRNKHTWHFNKAVGYGPTPDKIREAHSNGKPSGREWGDPEQAPPVTRRPAHVTRQWSGFPK
jgi:hypothetical protein